MKVIVVGCGRLGSELAYRLYKRGHEVSVIDSVAAAFHNLPSDFQGRIHEGDVLNLDVLRRAGIAEAEALAAVTSSDMLNLVIGQIAQTEYHIKRVVARNYDPHLRSLYEDFGLQLISSTSWGAQRLEEMLYHQEVRTVFSAGNGEVEVYELTIPAAWNGHKLAELMVSDECAAVALTRTGRAMLPKAETTLETGDVLNVSATFGGIEAVRACLSRK